VAHGRLRRHRVGRETAIRFDDRARNTARHRREIPNTTSAPPSTPSDRERVCVSGRCRLWRDRELREAIEKSLFRWCCDMWKTRTQAAEIGHGAQT
jgi:hypothetical protein